MIRLAFVGFSVGGFVFMLARALSIYVEFLVGFGFILLV